MIPFPVAHWGSGAFTASPSFFAPLTHTMVPTTALGGSGFSFSRSGTTAYVPDWENVLRLAAASPARFVGARMVRNLLAKSEALDDAAWTKASATIGTGVSDPEAGTSAFTMTATGVNAGLYQRFQTQPNPVTLVSSVWIRRRTGTGTVRLLANATGGSVGATLTLTSSWQRFSVAESGGADRYFFIEIATNTDAIDLWHPQYEDVTGQGNQNPSEYVSTGVLSAPFHGSGIDSVKCYATENGNTVASNVVTEASGTAITVANGASSATCDASGPFGFLIEETRSNLLQATSETFSNAAWTKTRTTITADSTAGPSGYVTADTINEDNSTNTHTVGQTLVKAASAITYTFSVYLKQSGRTWATVGIQSATNWAECYFDVGNGVVGSSNATGFTFVSAEIKPAANGFYRCIITGTTDATTVLVPYITPASADNTNNIVGLNAAALIAWGAQIEVGSFVTTLSPQGATSHVSEAFSYSTFASNASATVGTAYAEVTSEWATAPAANPIVAFGTATAYPLYSNSEAATVIRTNDGTNNVAKTGLSSTATGVRKRAASWTGTTLAITGDGATAATGTFDGNMGSTAIGVGGPTTYTGVVWTGTIRNVKLYTVAANAAQLKTLTA